MADISNASSTDNFVHRRVLNSCARFVSSRFRQNSDVVTLSKLVVAIEKHFIISAALRVFRAGNKIAYLLILA